MSATLLLLGRKLLVGAYSGASVAPPNIAHLGVTSGFSSVDVDPVNTVSAQFTLYRVGGDPTLPYTLTYTVVPSALAGVTAAYLSNAAVLSGVTVTFAAGQSSTTVSIVFAAHAKPAADLSGSVVLSGASGGSQIDAASASFGFSIPAAVVVAGGAYDLGPDYTLNATLQTGTAVGTTVTQEADGIVVDNGTSQADQNVSALVWFKTALPLGAWKARFSYTQLDSDLASQSNGIFATFVPGYTGGRNSSAANPSSWTTAEYRDASFLTTGKASKAVLDKYGTGIRASFNQDAQTLSNSDEMRSHKINSDGTETNLGGAAYGASWVFDSGTEYLVEVSYYPSTSRMNWVRTDPLGASTQVSVIDPNVALAVGQYLGFGVSAARSARWRAFSVTSIADDGGGGGGGGGGGAAWEDDPANWSTATALAAGTVVSFSAAATLNGTAAGHRYVMSADINAPTTTVTIDGTGTIGSPIVIDGGVTNPASYRLLRLKEVIVQNASHVYFQNLDLSDTHIRVLGTSNHISLEKFLAYGRTGGIEEAQLLVGRDNSPADGANIEPIRYVRTRYFQYGKAGVATEAPLWRYHGAPQTNYLYPNHARFMYCYRGWFTNVSEGAVFNCVYGMWGDNTRDNARDLKLAVYDNRVEGCSTVTGSMDLIEIKCSGVVVARNTYERGVANKSGFLKNRHGQNDYIGNLFVTRPGATGGAGTGGITIRDTGVRVYNNHAYTLADGVQPTLSSPAGHAGDQVHVQRGFLDAELFPANAGDPPHDYGDGVKGQMEPSTARCKVGGNNMPVVIGDDSSAVSIIPPCFNIVPGADAARRDRNKSITLITDVDFAGRTKYRLASTGTPVYVGPPAYGTHTANHTTDSTTSLVADGADITVVPHRWLVSEVGPGAAP